MMLEKTLPAGTATFFHLHPDSDKVAWVRAGELTSNAKWSFDGHGIAVPPNDVVSVETVGC